MKNFILIFFSITLGISGAVLYGQVQDRSNIEASKRFQAKCKIVVFDKHAQKELRKILLRGIATKDQLNVFETKGDIQVQFCLPLNDISKEKLL